ncbi:MAG: corrinoid protein [Eubacteriales bacterium]|nr:corrinoid protein [Eubacteriales bacterium]
MDELLDKMRLAVLEGDEDLAKKLAEASLEQNLDLTGVMDKGFLKGIMEAGQLYEDGEYFLPELICSADAMKVALDILNKRLKETNVDTANAGKIVLATVQGDVHDIGKTIVGAMFTAAGYEIHDLGANVPNEDVVKAVKDIKPDILGLSALLTTTMEEQRNIINILVNKGLRDSVKVIVGGAPVSREWAHKIMADGYSDNAIAAVKLARELLA